MEAGRKGTEPYQVHRLRILCAVSGSWSASFGSGGRIGSRVGCGLGLGLGLGLRLEGSIRHGMEKAWRRARTTLVGSRTSISDRNPRKGRCGLVCGQPPIPLAAPSLWTR